MKHQQREEYSKNKRGLQFLVAKGQEGIKALQTQISEGNSKRRQEVAESAMRDMTEAGLREKELRSLYQSVSKKDIIEHTNSVIGELLRIRDI